MTVEVSKSEGFNERGFEEHRPNVIVGCGEREKLRGAFCVLVLTLWLDDVAGTGYTRKETAVILVWVTVADPLGILASCLH